MNIKRQSTGEHHRGYLHTYSVSLQIQQYEIRQQDCRPKKAALEKEFQLCASLVSPATMSSQPLFTGHISLGKTILNHSVFNPCFQVQNMDHASILALVAQGRSLYSHSKRAFQLHKSTKSASKDLPHYVSHLYCFLQILFSLVMAPFQVSKETELSPLCLLVISVYLFVLAHGFIRSSPSTISQHSYFFF